MVNKNSADSVLILGGAGFIGSNIAMKFHQAGYSITVIDGLMPKTGGKPDNLKSIIDQINFISSKIEDVQDLQKFISKCNIIIDCMAWTAHNLGNKEPFYDLKLNVESHLFLINELIKNPDKKVIYLGSRGQYGNPQVPQITEDTTMNPEDIQGVHKLCAESYYRIYAKLCGLNVVSLRFPNCFGQNQPTKGKDIGLIGSFIRDLLEDKTLDLFDGRRIRHLVYVKDLSAAVFQISRKRFCGFNPFNLAGRKIYIEELVKALITIVGKGSYKLKAIPKEIRAIDIGSAEFSNLRLEAFMGKIPTTKLTIALKETVDYFKRRQDDS